MNSAQPSRRHDTQLTTLAQTLGQALTFDDQGEIAFQTAEGLELVISKHEGGTGLRVALGRADESSLRQALLWNYQSPASSMRMGLCPDSNQLMLLGWMESEDPDDLASAVVALLAAAEPLQQAQSDQLATAERMPIMGMQP